MLPSDIDTLTKLTTTIVRTCKLKSPSITGYPEASYSLPHRPVHSVCTRFVLGDRLTLLLMTSLPYYRDAEKGFPQVAGSCPTVRRGSTQPRKFLFVGLSTQTRHSPFDIFSLVRYPKIAGKPLSEFLIEAGIPRLLAVCLSLTKF